MLLSIYFNKSLLYLLFYCVFKFIFYIALTNYFSSFLYPLYLISISKIFSFILYKIKNKIQSIQSNDNLSLSLENQEQLLYNQEPNNISNNNSDGSNGSPRNSNRYRRKKKIISWAIIFTVSCFELIFYGLFNKIHDGDSNKRGYYYLMNNKLFFLLVLALLNMCIFKEYINKHNILAIAILIVSQIGLYFINYFDYFQNLLFLIYSFFMNITYSVQNFFEKKLMIINDNHEKKTMYLASEEGILELIMVIILTIAVKWYFGVSFEYDVSLTVKFVFTALCILLSEFIRMDALYKYNPFYICFFEEIIYIGFSIYNTPEKELKYFIFHIINIIAFFIFIEIIELNFYGLNQKTLRYLRERELDRLNQLIAGMGNGSSSVSTGTNSSGNNDSNEIQNNINSQTEQNHEIILNDDLLNLEIIDNNDNINFILGKEEIDNDFFEDNKDINLTKNDIDININFGKMFDDEE